MTVKLHYQSYGEGKPVLLLHGMFGTGRNWTTLARKLALHHRVLTVDLPFPGPVRADAGDDSVPPERFSTI